MIDSLTSTPTMCRSTPQSSAPTQANSNSSTTTIMSVTCVRQRTVAVAIPDTMHGNHPGHDSKSAIAVRRLVHAHGLRHRANARPVRG